MIDEVDELFGRSGDAATVRVGPVLSVLALGMVLITAGMAVSVVPGVIVVLVARAMVDKEGERLRNGFLPADSSATVRSLRIASTVVLVLATLALFLQGWMVWSGWYEWWIYRLLDMGGLLHGLPDP